MNIDKQVKRYILKTRTTDAKIIAKDLSLSLNDVNMVIDKLKTKFQFNDQIKPRLSRIGRNNV